MKIWGPGSETTPPSLREAQAYCRRMAVEHYENFTVASWILPRDLRQHFYNVYAYCRWSDDLGDEVADRSLSLELLTWWEKELVDCQRGEARHPVFIALQQTIQLFQIPITPFLNLLTAFRQDQSVTRYDSFQQLLEYCQNSANPVGRIVLYLCQSARPETFELSDSICTGLQLANFCQDVARDAEMGRCYLPRDERLKFGCLDTDLSGNRNGVAFRELMRCQVDRARHYLLQGLPLVRLVPRRIRLDIELFAQGGLRILEKIEQSDYQVRDRRPQITKWDAARLFWTSWWRTWY